jgi:hypothetical protein
MAVEQPKQARGLSVPQLEGVYIQNRRGVLIQGTVYPIEITASKVVLQWVDNQTVKGELDNGVFYPHIKLNR